MTHKKLSINVEGAPFYIGATVRVLEPADETGYPHLVGKIGTVYYYEYKCGCGQSYPNDPMIGVIFPDREKPAEFWQEELELVEVVNDSN